MTGASLRAGICSGYASVEDMSVNGSRDVGLEQIRAGLAWWYRAYSKEQTPGDRERYERAEQEAKANKVGLWRDLEPVPPWEWRKGR